MMDARLLDIAKIRADFPILDTKVRGKPLIYLDNAATTLKPRVVVDAIANHYLYGAANVHRGLHYLSEEATRHYEGARETVRAFINARETAEIIFTSGTTEAINLVAMSYGGIAVRPGDEIIITHMEHHSNIVPWQMLCERQGAVLRVAPIDDHGEIIWSELERLFSEKTRLVALVAVSNSLGTINPFEKVIALAHARDIPVVLDAAQGVAHMPFDVQKLEVDFMAFSAHKLYGPTGVGVLYGRRALLEKMPPVFGGGDMIRSVSFEKTTYASLPARLEAGTPNIAGVIGLGAAIEYVKSLGLAPIAAYEQELLAYGTRRLKEIDGLRLVGTARHKGPILAFTLDDVHPHDIGSLLDQEGIAIRAGHHCTQTVMTRYNVPATARASLAFYNTKEDIDALVAAIYKVKEMFA